MKAIEVVGWLGGACFFSRFLVQWIASERARRSVSPTVFWRLSVLGCTCLAAYTLAATIAVLALLTTVPAALLMLPSDPSRGWLACVVLGQLLWSSRFVVQWWSSERSGESHFPSSFWWISPAGNSLLLAYALHLGDAVLVAGYAVGPCVQVRNLMLLPRRAPRGGPGRELGNAPRTAS